MTLNPLTAISPIDGRYRNKVEELSDYFSEAALIRYRIRIEVEYLICLSEVLPQLEKIRNDEDRRRLRALYDDFSLQDAEEEGGRDHNPIIIANSDPNHMRNHKSHKANHPSNSDRAPSRQG